MDTDLKLNCWFIDEDAMNIPLSPQPINRSVEGLKYLILKLIRLTGRFKEFELWKVSIPLGDDIVKYSKQLKPGDALPDMLTLGEIFPSAPPGFIHMIAKVKRDETLPPAKRARVMDNDSSYECDQKRVTEASWNFPYNGNAPSIFIETMNQSLTVSYYAQYLQVIQFSGTGKSRMIDEVSKTILTIPINLRNTDKGYPPPDEGVTKWFTQTVSQQSHSFLRSHTFLVALSIITLEYIEEFVRNHRGRSRVDLPKLFWTMMREGQTYSSPGSRRKIFFAQVIALAEKMLPKPVTPPPGERPAQIGSSQVRLEHNGNTLQLAQSFKALLESIEKYDHITGPTTSRVRLLLAFDEAHVIYKSLPQQTWSVFGELRHALQVLNQLDIFSVFLSTTGTVDLLAPNAELDPSERLQHFEINVHSPFTALGFDQLAFKAKDGSHTIDDIIRPEFLFSMGRPLFGSRYSTADKEGKGKIRDEIATFARQKLTNTTSDDAFSKEAEFAVLAVRMALEFNATTYAAADMEQVQIEKHMRICIGIAEGDAPLVSIAPSEPALVEGAIRAMRKMEVPQALLQQLKMPGISIGDGGELVSMLLMLLARDKMKRAAAPLPILKLLRTLFNVKHHTQLNTCLPTDCPDTLKAKTLPETFANSYCHFTHFVKVNDYEAINRRFLWRMMVRGAAILCADKQRSVDIIIPVCIQGRLLQETNMTVILVQSKNDPSFSSYNQTLFDLMHPVVLGIFPSGVEDIPIIRLVFSLGSNNSNVSLASSQPGVFHKPKARRASEPIQHYKPAYDIWASRPCSETFAIIQPKENSTYEDILMAHRVFPRAYEMNENGAECVSRSMHPGAGIEESHWAKFAPL